MPVVLILIYASHWDATEAVLDLADYEPIEVHYIQGRAVTH